MFASKSRTKQLLIVLLAALLILTTMYTALPSWQAYAAESTIETDKDVYEIGDPIYVTASTDIDGAWVSLLNESDANNDKSYYWYYVNGSDSGMSWENGETYNIVLDTVCSNRDGYTSSWNFPAGDYKVVMLKGDYELVVSKSFTITAGTTPEGITAEKTTFSSSDPVLVSTVSHDTAHQPWVGLYSGTKIIEDTFDDSYIDYYYCASQNGQVDLTSKIKALSSGEGGEYTVALFNGGYVPAGVVNFTYEGSTLTVNKEGVTPPDYFPEYKTGEPLLVTAQSGNAGAWVGIFDYAPDYPDGYYARFDVKDFNGSVDIAKLASDAGKPLNPGKYRIYLVLNINGNPADWVKQVKVVILETYGDPTWTWDNNHTSATATFTAKHDPTITKTITVTGDNISSVVTKEATEEEDGERTYTATITADMIDFVTENDAPFTDEATEVIPKLTHVHKIEAVAAKDPTCEEAGNIAYYECTGCHKFFEDAEGTNEIEDKNSVVIAALGHVWSEWTCDEASYETDNKTHSRECARCEKKETQACTFVITQSDPDFEDRTCSVCGGHYQQMVIPVITTDKAEYKVGEDIVVKTELNGTNGTVTGGWVALYQKGSQGSSYGTSLLWYFPDPSYWGGNTKVLQSVLHPSDTNLENLGEWPAAWGEKLPVGEYELVFLSGGKPYTMTGHPCYFSVVRVPVSEEVTKDPTCTEPGNKHIVYDDGTEEDVAIPALGHDFAEEWVHDSETRTHHHVCKRCGEDSDPEACVFDEGKVTKEPTETETGTKLFTCTVCGGTYEEEIPTLAASGVRRAYGSNRYQTAMVQADLLKAELGLEKFDTIIVATGTNYADALSGAYLGYVNKAPILLVNGGTVDSVKDYIKKNLNEGGKVYLLGGEAVVPAAVEEGMDAYKFERLAGSNRYATNIEILKAANVTNEDILVCDGGNFADSLSASAVARPILLVKGALNDAQKEYLASLPGNNYYMIGGTGAVPASIENDIMSNYGSTARIGGGNRFETSTMVAEAFFDAPEKAVVAYAMNYPDGLCGGTLAAYMNAPLILVRDSSLTYAEKYMTDNKIGSGIVLGGPALIADTSARTLFSLAEDDEIYVIQYE